MKNSSVTGAAVHMPPAQIALDAAQGASSSNASAQHPQATSPRKPHASHLPPRAAPLPPPKFEELNVDSVASVLAAGDPAGSASALRSAANLAQVCKPLRDAVAKTGRLPPIGPLLNESALALTPVPQALFESRLPGSAAGLQPLDQVVLTNQLIDRFGQVPAGEPRTQRFDALSRMASTLPLETASHCMTRLAQLVPLLAQDDHCHERTEQFMALLDRCHALEEFRVAPMCALARQVPRLSDATGARATAISALQAHAGEMAPADAARLHRALVGPMTCVGNAEARHALVDATFATLEQAMPPQLAADVLCDLSRHLNLLTQPEAFQINQHPAESAATMQLFERLCERACASPSEQHAQVLATLAPLCGILPHAFQETAFQQLCQQATGLPASECASILPLLNHQQAPVFPDSPEKLLADLSVIATNPARNDIGPRLANLPPAQRDSTLLALANGLDERIPAVARVQKFRGILYASEIGSDPVRRAVVTRLAARLDLLPAFFAGQLARIIVPASLDWPPEQRLPLLGAIAGHIDKLNPPDQCWCARRLNTLIRAMPPTDRAVALLRQRSTVQYIEDEEHRHSFVADLHLALMNQSRATRSAALPAWINQLTRFNAGSQGSEMLFSIHRETIQYQANSEAKTAILVALAQGLGNFNYSSRPLAANELMNAAHAMPPALGKPILRMLALQDAFKPWT